MLGLTALDPLGQVLSDTLPGDRSRLSWVVAKLCGLGVHVTVLAPGTKVPDADFRTEANVLEDLAAGKPSKGWYLGTDDVKRVRAYLVKAKVIGEDGTIALPNIGMHLGPSRYIAVDCDNEGDVVAWQEKWVSHERGEPPLPNVITPGKLQDGSWVHRHGRYFLYRVSGGLDLTSARELTRAEQIEAGREGWVAKAGHGTGVLLPPSVRAEGPYIYPDVPIVDAPEWLIALCTKAPPAPPRQRTEFDDEVDQSFEGVDWDDVLRGIAVRTPDDPDGCRVYRRYGGAPKSIVIHDRCEAVRGARCVTVHSDSIIGMFPALQNALARDGKPTGKKSVSWWSFVAAVRFDGNLRAAADYAALALPERHSYTPVDLSTSTQSISATPAVQPATAAAVPPAVDTVGQSVTAAPAQAVVTPAVPPAIPAPVRPAVASRVQPTIPPAPPQSAVFRVPPAASVVEVPVEVPVVSRFAALWTADPRPHLHLTPCGVCAADALRQPRPCPLSDSEEI